MNDDTKALSTMIPTKFSGAFNPNSLTEAFAMAKALAQSGLMPDALRNKPADVLVVILTGRELGLGTMQSVRSLNVIRGKAVMSAELLVALVKSKTDVCEYFRLVSSDEECATYETKRVGDPEPTTLSYTIEEAGKAQLIREGGAWTKHAPAMLRARASSALARATYPDLCLGIYSTDEGEEMDVPAEAEVAPIPDSHLHGDAGPAQDWNDPPGPAPTPRKAENPHVALGHTAPRTVTVPELSPDDKGFTGPVMQSENPAPFAAEDLSTSQPPAQSGSYCDEVDAKRFFGAANGRAKEVGLDSAFPVLQAVLKDMGYHPPGRLSKNWMQSNIEQAHVPLIMSKIKVYQPAVPVVVGGEIISPDDDLSTPF